jgi:putative phosphoribosyl transferase
MGFSLMFTNRLDAGHRLAQKLASYKNTQTIVVGLARGGVVVASALASQLSLPVDVLVVKKIAAPGNSEFAIGALAPDSVSIIHGRTASLLGVDEEYIKLQIANLKLQIKEKERLYRKGKKPLVVKDKTVILVDDGIATGATFEAAIKWCKAKKARRIVAAIPVMPYDMIGMIKPEVQELVVIETPADLGAVGQFYKQFDQVEDEEVLSLVL